MTKALKKSKTWIIINLSLLYFNNSPPRRYYAFCKRRVTVRQKFLQRFIIRKKFLFVLTALISFWLISLLYCGAATLICKDRFDSIAEFKEFDETSEFTRVVKYTPKEAVVYFVTDGKTMGSTIHFKKENGNWQYDYYDTVWSVSGSADKTLWPYLWHFFYSHRRL